MNLSGMLILVFLEEVVSGHNIGVLMKKILFVSPTGTLDNGAEISITNLMVLLTQEGYDIINVIPKIKHSTHDAYLHKMRENQIKVYELDYTNWWWESAPGVKIGHLEDRSAYYQKYIYEIRKIIAEEAVDLVITSTANLFQGALAAACERIPHYWIIHEFPLDEFAYYKELIPFIEEYSDKIFTVEGKLTEFLRPLLKESQKLFPFVPFVNIKKNNNLKTGEETRLISISRINENKNQLELLKAYQSMAEPKPELLFVGDWDDSYKEKCDDFIQSHQLKTVCFLGHQSNPWNLMTDKDILVLNSKMETFGLVFVEALIQGIPVLASNNYGYSSVVDYFGCGKLYHLGDEKELVALLNEFVTNFSEEKKKSLTQSFMVEEKYTIEKSYCALLDAISNENSVKSDRPIWLSQFLGAYNPLSTFSPAGKESISIYYRDENGNWSENQKLVFSLFNRDSFTFSVPKGMTRIRLDMSERPSYYDKITLVDSDTMTQLLPTNVSGFEENNSFYFNHSDPQMEFNVSFSKNNVFQLSYQLANLENIFQDSFLPNQLVQKLLSFKEKQSDLEMLKIENHQLQEKNKLKQEQLEEMVVRYNSVIHSRRWSIPTKMINFLRRKK